MNNAASSATGNPVLDGKIAIITGASRGIGAATARYFAGCGATVVLAARDQVALEAIATEISATGGAALAVPTDVGDPAAVEQLVTAAVDTYGRLDIAFNNAAGGPPPTPLADLSVEDYDLSIRVNLRGVFVCMKYEIAAMLKSGGGAIVNMSSTAGLKGVPRLAGYVSTKHGILGLTKTAALDYATQNIRVNAVAPGPILTERLAALTNEQRAPVVGAVPLRRIGQPQEVAATVAWLCSDAASFITGATIPIDGGRLASGA